MVIQDATELFWKHQKGTVKKSTLKSYGKFLERFKLRFSGYEVTAISPDDIGKFLEESMTTLSRATRHLRYAQIKAFLNYVIEVTGVNAKNPCNAAVLAKAYKNVPHRPRKILDKETVDELIFNAGSVRDRLILELQALCSLRSAKSSICGSRIFRAERFLLRTLNREETLKLRLCLTYCGQTR